MSQRDATNARIDVRLSEHIKRKLLDMTVRLEGPTECDRLHICFAALHTLGKTMEGSRMDTEAIKTRVYSSTPLRAGELAIFFNQYLKQVEAVLLIIAASRQCD